MANGPIPYPRQLQRNGLVMGALGAFATLVLALLHGGLEWSNIGLLFLAGGALTFVIGRALESRERRARLADEGDPRH